MSAFKEITVVVKVPADIPARAKDKIELLERFSNLEADDQQRLTELMSNPKALKALADNWTMLKLKLMIS